MENGFTVTNTNTEKISVPVKKVWVGKEAYSATIKLLADGTEKERVTLTKDDNWEHTFSNLPKYADDGHEIEYTVDEVHIDGYSTTISGTAATRFTITNRKNPSVVITPVPPVTPTPVTPSPINPISPVTPVTPIKPVTPITPSPISPITPISPSPINPISPVTPVTPIKPVTPITPSPISPITPVSPSPINPISPVTPVTPIKPVNPITPSQITPSRIATPSIATSSNGSRGGSGSSGGNADVRPAKAVTTNNGQSKNTIDTVVPIIDKPVIETKKPTPQKATIVPDTRKAMSVPKTADSKDVRGYFFILISSLAAAISLVLKKKEIE